MIRCCFCFPSVSDRKEVNKLSSSPSTKCKDKKKINLLGFINIDPDFLNQLIKKLGENSLVVITLTIILGGFIFILCYYPEKNDIPDSIKAYIIIFYEIFIVGAIFVYMFASFFTRRK